MDTLVYDFCLPALHQFELSFFSQLTKIRVTERKMRDTSSTPGNRFARNSFLQPSAFERSATDAVVEVVQIQLVQGEQG